MSGSDSKLPEKPQSGEVAAFLEKLAQTPAPRPSGERGRLLFGLDATASRQPSWDRAMHLQAEMFSEAARLGGLDIQLAYYRGFGEFKTTGWLSDSDALLRRMTGVTCLGGRTQIGRLLAHALGETRARKVNAVVFVGDAMEEDADRLCHRAGELGMLGVPLFIFHERGEAKSAECFRQMAKLSGGAYCRFDAGSARELRDLLRAVAVYATGGALALADFGKRAGGPVLQLTGQLKR
jgi:hypothetical protein